MINNTYISYGLLRPMFILGYDKQMRILHFSLQLFEKIINLVQF
jgi:hypothetical protein